MIELLILAVFLPALAAAFSGMHNAGARRMKHEDRMLSLEGDLEEERERRRAINAKFRKKCPEMFNGENDVVERWREIHPEAFAEES